jgi:hypothetical protein
MDRRELVAPGHRDAAGGRTTAQSCRKLILTMRTCSCGRKSCRHEGQASWLRQPLSYFARREAPRHVDGERELSGRLIWCPRWSAGWCPRHAYAPRPRPQRRPCVPGRPGRFPLSMQLGSGHSLARYLLEVGPALRAPGAWRSLSLSQRPAPRDCIGDQKQARRRVVLAATASAC